METAQTDLNGVDAVRDGPKRTPSGDDLTPARDGSEAQAAARRYLDLWDLAQAEISRIGPGFLRS